MGLCRTSPLRSSQKFAKRRASSASPTRLVEPVVISGLRIRSPPLGGAPSAHTQEDVFAVLLDPVDLIDVGRVFLAMAALHDIPYPVPGAVDCVVFVVAVERVSTGIAVYAVVTVSANHRVVASPGVKDVRTCQTRDVVRAPTGVDYVIFICAYEVVWS